MITFKLNGKTLTEGSFQDAIEKAVYTSVVKKISKRVTTAAGADAAQVQVDILGSSLYDLRFSVSGPDDAVARVRQAFSNTAVGSQP